MRELTAKLDLPDGVDALTTTRQVTRTALTGWGLGVPRWVDDAVLVADELVANAVRHGGGCLRLHIHADGKRVTIAAVDSCAVVPRRRDPDSHGGRGWPSSRRSASSGASPTSTTATSASGSG